MAIVIPAGVDPTGIRNVAKSTINPATSENQQQIISMLESTVGFDIPTYDSIEITYVASGLGVGEIETVVYKLNGNIISTLTLYYNNANKLSLVSKS